MSHANVCIEKTIQNARAHCCEAPTRKRRKRRKSAEFRSRRRRFEFTEFGVMEHDLDMHWKKDQQNQDKELKRQRNDQRTKRE